MRAFALFYNVGTVLIYPALIATLVLYLYPAFFGCDFPAPTRTEGNELSIHPSGHGNISIPRIAPFRLLVLADPQLEGDTSLPNPSDPTFPQLHRLLSGNWSSDDTTATAVARGLSGFIAEDIPLLFATYRKRLDLLGNDFYLAHIYRTLYWWTQPTHVTVLGDLIGSQWITDGEFEWRGWRYWNRVFKYGQRVEDNITEARGIEELGKDERWSSRLINIAGNHDVGYAGDMTPERLERFERVYGKANWIRTFQLATNQSYQDNLHSTPSSPPELRLVVFNSMALDGPALDGSLQEDIYSFMNNEVIIPAKQPSLDPPDKTFTILLTHIPLHKAAGICVDAPMFDYHPNGCIREQNHLSPGSSKSILEGIFGISRDLNAPARGMGRPGIILNGHDHEGCDVYHHIDRAAMNTVNESDHSTIWAAARYSSALDLQNDGSLPGIREITGRSMMGSFGGYAGMLSAWFSDVDGQWHYAYTTCHLGVQHGWWFVHVLVLVTALCWVAAGLAIIREHIVSETEQRMYRNRLTPISTGAVRRRAKIE